MIPQPLGSLVITIVGGIFCLVAGQKLKTPAILFLLLFGIGFGPDFLNLIQPSFIQTIFAPLISLLVALVLFEGGASLKISQYRDISGVLKRLLTIGAFVTLAVGTAAAYFIARMPVPQAILFGAIMIVTGPTVVLPILQRIRVNARLHNILRWEAILIDPLGVIVAVVVYEIFPFSESGALHSLGAFALRILIGMGLGWIAGRTMHIVLSQARFLRFESEELGGLFLLATNLLFYGISEAIVPHSGLVTAAMAGITIGNKPISAQDQVFQFERQVTLFALSVLFILISSQISVNSIIGHINEGLAVLAVLIFIARPLTVFLSARGDRTLGFFDKLFLSSIAPRGIVSASLATLFAFGLQKGSAMPLDVFLPVSFIVIAGTILFYSIIPVLVARHPAVRELPRKGIVIIGANPFGLLIAEELRKKNCPPVFIDTNPVFCDRARKHGFETYRGSATDADFIHALDLKGVGSALAVTPNHELNVLACRTLSQFLGKNEVYRMWDKSDAWETVSSPNYDHSWGRPLIISPSEQTEGLWSIVSEGADPVTPERRIGSLFRRKEYHRRYRIASVALEESLTVTPDNIAARQIHYPLFAINKDQLVFLVVETSLPKGCEVTHIEAAS